MEDAIVVLVCRKFLLLLVKCKNFMAATKDQACASWTPVPRVRQPMIMRASRRFISRPPSLWFSLTLQ